jgi:GTP pyrophosphokinase
METLLTRAYRLAAELHATQVRKASVVPAIPYLAHLMEVSGIALANGATETVAAAALLHDAIEDQGEQTAELIREQLGLDVLALVEECTEPGARTAVKAPWRERKEAYIQHVYHASAGALIIIAADKLHNLRDLRKQVFVYGQDAYGSFSTGKEQKLWFYRGVLKAEQQRLNELRPEISHEQFTALNYVFLEQQDLLSYLQTH